MGTPCRGSAMGLRKVCHGYAMAILRIRPGSAIGSTVGTGWLRYESAIGSAMGPPRACHGSARDYCLGWVRYGCAVGAKLDCDGCPALDLLWARGGNAMGMPWV